MTIFPQSAKLNIRRFEEVKNQLSLKTERGIRFKLVRGVLFEYAKHIQNDTPELSNKEKENKIKLAISEFKQNNPLYLTDIQYADIIDTCLQVVTPVYSQKNRIKRLVANVLFTQKGMENYKVHLEQEGEPDYDFGTFTEPTDTSTVDAEPQMKTELGQDLVTGHYLQLKAQFCSCSDLWFTRI